jgi:hypothetical protein
MDLGSLTCLPQWMLGSFTCLPKWMLGSFTCLPKWMSHYGRMVPAGPRRSRLNSAFREASR